ncbi:uncharacterized protein LOC128259746 [Drosophila gunungcola]|uniref:Secreted protein n=1 Tax=Drosophila gunungcola TaxID=103775 RepID=A0A9Q0BN57_9MUSC|nr:uncharacterized protein LOC128259746 [Drosophila gunungcola]XP_052848258.1 uncharacterized protein LOC128259746 [Drosophila gunungcola]KAI8037715.1 hypothetical protein M5D96_009215 [Drosophila gunungcola]
MSLAWIMLLGLLNLEKNAFGVLATASPHYRVRSAFHPTIKVGHRRTRRTVRETRSDGAVPSLKNVQHDGALNTSISTSDRVQYNVWQVLKADGRANLCVLFFTIYISYLVYVVF